MKKIILNWAFIDYQLIDRNKYNDILKSLKENKELRQIEPVLARRSVYFYNTYSIVKNESYLEIRVYTDEGKFKYRYTFAGAEKGTERAGYEGYNLINSMFKEEFDTTKSIYQVFSGEKYKELNKEIKKCVITQVDYARPQYVGKRTPIEHCYKSDVSSAYPYQMSKNLPTMHDCKVLSGRVEPTEEYPFAFYVNSHHVKIYNELYTRDFKKSNFYAPYFDNSMKWRPNDFISPEEDKTILCKSSKYSLKNIFQEMYNHRKDNEKMKLWMVASIGYFHKNTNPFLSQIAAVVLARCAKEMIDRAEYLREEGNIVVLINTDSIIWKGQQSKLSENKKYLGSFSIEYEDTKVLIKGVKAYQIMKPDGTALTRHSGLSKEISKNLKFGEIFDCEGLSGNGSFIIINEDGYLEEANIG